MSEIEQSGNTQADVKADTSAAAESDTKNKGLVLVTGISGYIGSQVCSEFLKNGYRVRGSVRVPDAKKHDTGIKAVFADELKSGALSLVQATLLDADSWTAACQGCDYVAHVASPFIIDATSKDAEEKLYKPARDGVLNVLKAATASGTVQRVVMTSSMAAISVGHQDLKSLDDPESLWSEFKDSDEMFYLRSKTLSERAAWAYVNGEGKGLELVAINPCLVTGPALVSNGATSHEIPVRLLNRKMPMVPDMRMSYVDVRDVARAHRLALEVKEAAGHRFACVAGPFSLLSMAQMMSDRYGPLGYKVPTTQLPYALAWCISFFDGAISTILGTIGKDPAPVNCSKIQTVLGLSPWISIKDSTLAHAESVVALGIQGTPQTAQYKALQKHK